MRIFITNRYVLFCCFILLFISVRIPFYSMPLVGEDGIFADLLISAPSNPDYILVGRVDGHSVYTQPEHPALMYEAIRIIGKVIGADEWKTFSHYKLTFILRSVFSSFQFIVFLGLVITIMLRDKGVCISKRSLTLVGCVSIVACSPLAILSSVSLQVDGTSGIVMTGLLSIIILIFHNRLLSYGAFLPLGFIASLIIGFGKNEWSVVLVIALLIALLYCLVIKMFSKNEQVAQHVGALALFLLGNLTGNLISYIYDPSNYISGFKVISRVIEATGYAQSFKFKKKLLNLYIPTMCLLFLTFVIPKKMKQGDLWVFFLSIFGAGLFGSFFLSAWAVDVRYFAPSLIPILCACIMVFPFEEYFLQKRLLIIVLISIAIPSMINICGRIPLHNKAQVTIQAMYAGALKENSNHTCIPILSSAIGFRLPIDFIGDAISYEDAKLFVQRNGKTLCRQ